MKFSNRTLMIIPSAKCSNCESPLFCVATAIFSSRSHPAGQTNRCDDDRILLLCCGAGWGLIAIRTCERDDDERGEFVCDNKSKKKRTSGRRRTRAFRFRRIHLVLQEACCTPRARATNTKNKTYESDETLLLLLLLLHNTVQHDRTKQFYQQVERIPRHAHARARFLFSGWLTGGRSTKEITQKPMRPFENSLFSPSPRPTVASAMFNKYPHCVVIVATTAAAAFPCLSDVNRLLLRGR